MPTYDKNNPLTFPVRIFDVLTISTDKDGNTVHGGDYVEYHRKATDPKPSTLAEAKALLAKQVKKDASLVTIVTKARAGLDEAQTIIAAVKELRASAKPEAVKWKAEAKAVEVVGGSVVADVKPVDVKPVDPVLIDPIAEEPIK